MPDATQTTDWRDDAFDLTRGIAAYTGSRLVHGLARVIDRHPQAEIAVAFNHKQVASKLWARDRLHEAMGGDLDRLWILGGWYGVLAAMLLEDARFRIGAIDSFDIDPAVAPIAETLVGADERFRALTEDMHALDYAGAAPGLVVNTSCEHISDLRHWLGLLPHGQPVLLQSNDYFAEPSHISSMPTLTAFRDAAALSEVRYAGELPLKKYTRFMLIGQV